MKNRTLILFAALMLSSCSSPYASMTPSDSASSASSQSSLKTVEKKMEPTEPFVAVPLTYRLSEDNDWNTSNGYPSVITIKDPSFIRYSCDSVIFQNLHTLVGGDSRFIASSKDARPNGIDFFFPPESLTEDGVEGVQTIREGTSESGKTKGLYAKTYSFDAIYEDEEELLVQRIGFTVFVCLTGNKGGSGVSLEYYGGGSIFNSQQAYSLQGYSSYEEALPDLPPFQPKQLSSLLDSVVFSCLTTTKADASLEEYASVYFSEEGRSTDLLITQGEQTLLEEESIEKYGITFARFPLSAGEPIIVQAKMRNGDNVFKVEAIRLEFKDIRGSLCLFESNRLHEEGDYSKEEASLKLNQLVDDLSPAH